MFRQHEFLPITNNNRFNRAIEYVAEQSVALGRVVLARELDIDTICFFAHTPDELVFLRQAVLARGSKSRFTHGHTLYADTDFMVKNWRVKLLGVRDVTEPDPQRTQAGYCDYPVNDFDVLVEQAKNNKYANAKPSGQGVPLIELRHPDFDVLGFVVDAKDHQV